MAVFGGCPICDGLIVERLDTLERLVAYRDYARSDCRGIVNTDHVLSALAHRSIKCKHHPCSHFVYIMLCGEVFIVCGCSVCDWLVVERLDALQRLSTRRDNPGCNGRCLGNTDHPRLTLAQWEIKGECGTVDLIVHVLFRRRITVSHRRFDPGDSNIPAM